MADGRPISGIPTKQRGIGSVQRSHNRRSQIPRQHRAGQKGGCGVRHGIVDMQDIQMILGADFRHFYRERERVIRVTEESVIIDLHRMEMNSWGIGRKPKRMFVADEMHLVTTQGQLFPEAGCQNAAPSDRRIAGDSDL